MKNLALEKPLTVMELGICFELLLSRFMLIITLY